jgi:dolichyl-phosphate beta-glucosyltransferase
MHLSIVVPAYNEASRIAPFLDDLAAYVSTRSEPTEVIVVDDGSTDTTVGIVEAYRDRFPALRIVPLPTNRGKGGAVAAGMLVATGAWRAFIDADGATPPDEIDHLLAAATERPRSVAIASLRVPGAEVVRSQTALRSAAGRIGNAIIRGAVLPGIRDSQRGAKLFPGPVADRVFEEMRTTGWAFDIDALARCRAIGYEIVEVPVRWHHVDGGVVRPSSYLWTLHEVWSIRRSLRADGIRRRPIDSRRRRARGLRPLRRAA